MTCYFDKKDIDDITRFVNEKIYLYLKDREITQKEEGAIRSAMKDVITTRLLNHEMNCKKERGADWYVKATLLIAIAAILVSLFVQIF